MAYLARCTKCWHVRGMVSKSQPSSRNVSLSREQKSYVDPCDITRDEIELRLLAALESPRRELTAADWKQFRKDLVKRHTRRHRG